MTEGSLRNDLRRWVRTLGPYTVLTVLVAVMRELSQEHRGKGEHGKAELAGKIADSVEQARDRTS